jgi:molybdenum cofactor cytidylyltransferase
MTEPPPCSLPIVILAAGQSRRMRGVDKLMQEVEARPLIRRQTEMALRATSGPVIVTLPPPPHPRYEALQGTRAKIVAVPDALDGMSASLRRGLWALPEDAPAVMVLLADLPELTSQDLRHLCAKVDLDSDTLIWRGATADGAPGHPIVFARALVEPLCALQGDSGGAEVVARYRDRMMLVRLPQDRARRDLDTPEDWAAWREDR